MCENKSSYTESARARVCVCLMHIQTQKTYTRTPMYRCAHTHVNRTVVTACSKFMQKINYIISSRYRITCGLLVHTQTYAARARKNKLGAEKKKPINIFWYSAIAFCHFYVYLLYVHLCADCICVCIRVRALLLLMLLWCVCDVCVCDRFACGRYCRYRCWRFLFLFAVFFFFFSSLSLTHFCKRDTRKRLFDFYFTAICIKCLKPLTFFTLTIYTSTDVCNIINFIFFISIEYVHDIIVAIYYARTHVALANNRMH